MSAVFDYAGARAVAEGLIAYFGRTGTIQRPAVGAVGDPWNPTGAGAPVDYPVKLAVDPDGYTASAVAGSRIQITDKKVYVSTENIDPTKVLDEPKVSDRLIVGSVSHEIISVKPMDPAGTVVMWEVAARV